jgi:zinc finger HIT domain-containing protein 1
VRSLRISSFSVILAHRASNAFQASPTYLTTSCLCVCVAQLCVSATRQAQSSAHPIDPILVAKRTKRHLDELERSNYAEPSVNIDQEDDDGAGAGSARRGRAARQSIISDRRGSGTKKSKSTMNVRSALLYRKNLASLIDESGIAGLPASSPTYLTALAPPSKVPLRLLCSVCGYWGSYKCKKCAMAYCDRNCEGIHNETRCERRVV